MSDVLRQIILHSVGSFGGTLGYAFLLNAPVSTSFITAAPLPSS